MKGQPSVQGPVSVPFPLLPCSRGGVCQKSKQPDYRNRLTGTSRYQSRFAIHLHSPLASLSSPTMAGCSKHIEYPEIVPGGGLILAWQLKGKKVLLVGGGMVAAGEKANFDYT